MPWIGVAQEHEILHSLSPLVTLAIPSLNLTDGHI